MTIYFFKITEEMDSINKTVTAAARKLTLTGTLRDECDVLNPAIQFEFASFPEYNYLYVVEFKRYYFITGIRSVRNGLWEISCHVDVLQTYRTEIRALKCMIERNENTYNVDIPDDKVSYVDTVTTYASGWNSLFTRPTTADDRYVVITTNGKGGTV